MHDVAWRGMWICVRSKDAQKQLARTSLNQTNYGNLDFRAEFPQIMTHSDNHLRRF